LWLGRRPARDDACGLLKSRDNAAWINNIFALSEAEQAKHANDLLVKGRFEDHAVGVPRITQLRERPWSRQKPTEEQIQ
jgi:hypothetical protein